MPRQEDMWPKIQTNTSQCPDYTSLLDISIFIMLILSLFLLIEINLIPMHQSQYGKVLRPYLSLSFNHLRILWSIYGFIFGRMLTSSSGLKYLQKSTCSAVSEYCKEWYQLLLSTKHLNFYKMNIFFKISPFVSCWS